MNSDLTAPVKGIANAFHRGTVKTQRICKSAQRMQATNILDTLQLAQSLEDSLTRSESRIRDAYTQSSAAFGRRFLETFEKDRKSQFWLH